MEKDSSFTKADTEAALLLCEKATEGPWELGPFGCIKGGPEIELTKGKVRPQVGLATMGENISSEARDANAALFVAARTALPAAIKALMKTADEMRIIAANDESSHARTPRYPDCGCSQCVAQRWLEKWAGK